MAKLTRGVYTDTFSPLLFTNLVTLPLSAANPAWHGYPAQFSAEAYRHAVSSAVASTAVNIAINATGILVVGVLLTYFRGRSRP